MLKSFDVFRYYYSFISLTNSLISGTANLMYCTFSREDKKLVCPGTKKPSPYFISAGASKKKNVLHFIFAEWHIYLVFNELSDKVNPPAFIFRNYSITHASFYFKTAKFFKAPAAVVSDAMVIPNNMSPQITMAMICKEADNSLGADHALLNVGDEPAAHHHFGVERF